MKKLICSLMVAVIACSTIISFVGAGELGYTGNGEFHKLYPGAFEYYPDAKNGVCPPAPKKNSSATYEEWNRYNEDYDRTEMSYINQGYNTPKVYNLPDPHTLQQILGHDFKTADDLYSVICGSQPQKIEV